MKLYTYLLLLEYYKENNSLKEINNNEHAKNVLDKEKVLYNKAKNNNEDWINNNENLDEQVRLNVVSGLNITNMFFPWRYCISRSYQRNR